MPLLRSGRFVADDWRSLAEEEAIPADGRIVVPLARLLGEAEALQAFAGELGVRIEPGQRVEQVEPWLPRLALVALSFPSFADGRAFSTARLLRQRYGFAGEIRAVGDVQIDRYQFMRQCGFDAFEIRPERADTKWARAEIEMSLTYQADYAEPRGAEAVWHARRVQTALAAE
jgi:phosphoadenosine phosphosulfate reductase